MKAKNAKPALRVQMKSKGSPVPQGTLGTITEVIDDGVCVHWDTNVGGWGDEEYSIPIGHGWAVPVSIIRKLKE